MPAVRLMLRLALSYLGFSTDFYFRCFDYSNNSNYANRLYNSVIFLTFHFNFVILLLKLDVVLFRNFTTVFQDRFICPLQYSLFMHQSNYQSDLFAVFFSLTFILLENCFPTTGSSDLFIDCTEIYYYYYVFKTRTHTNYFNCSIVLLIVLYFVLYLGDQLKHWFMQCCFVIIVVVLVIVVFILVLFVAGKPLRKHSNSALRSICRVAFSVQIFSLIKPKQNKMQ